MKHYEVEYHGLTYRVQLHPDTAEALGVEPVTDVPKKKNKVSRETRKKNVSRETRKKNVSRETPPAGEAVEGDESKE
uniref:Uncharacterized protein n=1 Tax=Siphoviridae sp. ct6bU4 TaxID=2825344 RepID=A0A8S5VAG3_9CAUD|nr:MAG TPA: hypothetical protein [Siphoviridae sp. ct6bU4]